jgi:hypothetical protein
MGRKEIKAKCLKDIYVHKLITNEYGKTYYKLVKLFESGKVYHGVFHNGYNNDEYTVLLINEEDLEHVVKPTFEDDHYFKDHFLIIN